MKCSASRHSLGYLALLALLAFPLSAATLDSFDALTHWKAAPAEGVELKLSSEAGREGKAMRMDFDFRGRGGYAIARREAPIDIPDNFEFSFWIRGEAPQNTLEFKLIDESGENVWWTTRREFEFPSQWKRISIKKRQIEFAWGPKGGGDVPRRIGALEVVVTAGKGGKGTVWIDELALGSLGTSSDIPLPKGSLSGKQIDIDLGSRHELGGLTLEWDSKRFPRNYAVRTSIDGREWETARTVRGSDGGGDWIEMPDGDARFIRIDAESMGRLRYVRFHPSAWSKTSNDFFSGVALDSRRGDWPRYLLGQMSYWTVTGTEDGLVEALVSEDGAVEAGNARFSIEPFVWNGLRLLTWADVETVQSLRDGYLPIPTVEWIAGGQSVLSLTAFVDASSTLHVRYRVPAGSRLYLAIRPLQVNTPWQFLRRTGGVVRVSRISFDGKEVSVTADQKGVVVPVSRPAGFGASSFDGGSIVEFLRQGKLPAAQSIDDPYGYASAALAFEQQQVEIAIPLAPSTPPRDAVPTEEQWARTLNRTKIEIPAWPDLVDSIRSNLAYILINRDGPSIQPGSRSYERSWIRDGSLTSTALLRLQHGEVVKRFLEWYSQFQSPDGRIPCCVSSAGADPVPEHDSHGQFIYLIAEYYRHTRDRELVERLWPRIVRTVEAIDALRHERMADQYRGTMFWGLMPESISHEGYSAKAMHSYWDDLFVLRGFKDAAFLADVLHRDEAPRYAELRDEFRRDLFTSMRRSIAEHKIDYLPGSAELGDFDATSTTILLSPVEEEASVPRETLLRTFDRYWETALATRDYTPYEWRAVGALLRIGEGERALALARRFFRDQRPDGWNQWAEVVFADPRKGGFVGDMPHTWVGSDFIRSALDLLAYESEADQTLVIGRGVPLEWVEKGGVRVTNLSTHHGPLTFSMAVEGGEVVVRIGDGISVPPGGITVVSPIDRQGINVRTLPAELRLRR